MPDLRLPGTAVPASHMGDPAPASGWVLIGIPLVSVVLIVVIVFAGTTGAEMLLHPSPSARDVQHYITGLYRNPLGVQSLVVVQDLVILLSIWLLLPKRGPTSLASYFRPAGAPIVLLAAISGAAAAMAIELGVSQLIVHHVVDFHATKTEQALVPTRLWDVLPSLFAVGVAAPFAEELYFRGVLLRWLLAKLPFLVAALISAALFALIHFKFTEHVGLEGWTLTGGIFVIGFVSAIWAARTRTLWPSIATHAAYNLVIIGLPMLAMFGQKG